MKENVFDVLIYLFENTKESKLYMDPVSMTPKLRQAGFLNSEIDKAFEWLEGLSVYDELGVPHAIADKHSTRIFSGQEQRKLTMECRGYLLMLEQIQIVDEITRELIIDRCMALETGEFSLDHLKWVVLLVIFNQPNLDADMLWIEDIIQAPVPHCLH